MSTINYTINIQLFIKNLQYSIFFNILNQFIQKQTIFTPNQINNHTHTNTTNLKHKYQY